MVRVEKTLESAQSTPSFYRQETALSAGKRWICLLGNMHGNNLFCLLLCLRSGRCWQCGQHRFPPAWENLAILLMRNGSRKVQIWSWDSQLHSLTANFSWWPFRQGGQPPSKTTPSFLHNKVAGAHGPNTFGLETSYTHFLAVWFGVSSYLSVLQFSHW